MATAIAHPNIALAKYWGKRDSKLNLPSTGSISLTLAPFHTRTTVRTDAEKDEAWINGDFVEGPVAERIFTHLDRIDPWRPKCTVVSHSDFPMSAGLASSASGLSALTVAGCSALGQDRNPVELSILSRRGSGSACRSIHGGWVEWSRGTREDGLDSHAQCLADMDHWDVSMVVAIFSAEEKRVCSTQGMNHTAATSPLYPGWVEGSEPDLRRAREAILDRNLTALGEVMEQSALRMHASMLGARPPLRYWSSSSVWGMDTVESLRAQGIEAWWTMDAGPNLKVLCHSADAIKVSHRLAALADRVEILKPGGPARLLIDEG